MPRWTKDDKAALERLVARHGAAKVAEQAKKIASSTAAPTPKLRGKPGRPPAAIGDAYMVWTAVEYLRRLAKMKVEPACALLSKHMAPHMRESRLSCSKATLKDLYYRAERRLEENPELRKSVEAGLHPIFEDAARQGKLIVPGRIEAAVKNRK